MTPPNFVLQSAFMETNWAAGHLQVIRTLMERAAIYRRALAPIMLLVGLLGTAAAVAARLFELQGARSFAAFWMSVGVVAISGAYVMVRRQALKESEPFWSPPTRRVTQAALPPLAAGSLIGAIFALRPEQSVQIVWLPVVWMILYGCAVHAAGFFMPRGMKLFGWGFVAMGCLCSVFLVMRAPWMPLDGHTLMGATFGAFHLAYGIYLYFTERTQNAA